MGARSYDTSTTVIRGMSLIAVGPRFLSRTKRVSVLLDYLVMLDTFLQFRGLTLDHSALTIFVVRFLLLISPDNLDFGFCFRRCLLLAYISAMTGIPLEIKVIVLGSSIVIYICKSNRYSYVDLVKSTRMTISFHQIFTLIYCFFFSFKILDYVMSFFVDVIKGATKLNLFLL